MSSDDSHDMDEAAETDEPLPKRQKRVQFSDQVEARYLDEDDSILSIDR